MRCVTCKRTGFTESELAAHEKKFGHVRPSDPREWSTSQEFPLARTVRFDRSDLIAALQELGVTITDGKITSIAGEEPDEPIDPKAVAARGKK